MSRSAQRSYFLIQKFNIISLILGSISAALVVATPATVTRWAYSALAIFLITSILLHGLSRIRRNDKVWFDCRAIAESVKTATWRFMMKIKPFEGDDDVAVQLFVEALKKIRQSRPFDAQRHLTENLNREAKPVSDVMINTRHMNARQRRDLYIESRLNDQIGWYLQKARLNSRKESFWFWAISTIQILAITFAIVQVALDGLPVNIIPLLMTCAASAIAWGQIKRYGELSQTYSLAAQELREQEVLVARPMEEANFLALVESIEETISREHTLWRVRRVY